MMQFLTQCPACQTSFKISDTQLDAADGMVRCGSCLEVFSAHEHKVTFDDNLQANAENPELKSSPENKLEATQAFEPMYDIEIEAEYEKNAAFSDLFEPVFDTEESTLEPEYNFYFSPEELEGENEFSQGSVLDTSVENEMSEPEALVVEVKKPKNDKTKLHLSLSQLEHENSLEILQPEIIAAIDEEPLEIINMKTDRNLFMNFFLGMCLLLFSISLFAQYTWFNLDAVVNNPRLSLVTDKLCQTLACPKSDFKDLSQLYTEELVVYSHPDFEDALKIDFIFSNNAAFDQLFPLAELSFNDTSERLLARRQFTPEEYLPAELEGYSLMPAHSSIQISLEIVDPGQNAINYSLDFK